MAILQLLTPFDYALVVVLGAILVFSLMEVAATSTGRREYSSRPCLRKIV